MTVLRNGMIQLSNADGTNLSAAIVTGAPTGTKIHEIKVCSGPATLPGTGKTFVLLMCDAVSGLNNVIEPQPVSNLVDAQQGYFSYLHLSLPNEDWSIKAAMRSPLAAGATLHITVLGEDQ